MSDHVPLDPVQSFALLLREHAIREARDSISNLADSLVKPGGAAGWRGCAADSFGARLIEHRARLRATLADLDSAEGTVRRWRQGS